MSALELLRAACLKKTYKGFKELSTGEYMVHSFSKVDTGHGTRIRIDLDEFYMFLPERFAITLNDKHLAELSATRKIMIYSGKDITDHNRLLLDFKEEEGYFADILTPF